MKRRNILSEHKISQNSRFSTFLLLHFFLILLIFTNDAVAQPLKLTFADALEMALKDNPQIRQAYLSIDKAKAQIGEAYSAAMPTLTAGGYYQRNFIIPEMVTEMPPDFGGGTVKFKFQQDNLLNAQLELTQPLYAAGRVGKALQIAKMYRQMTEQQLSQTQSETKLLITQLYFGAALAEEWAKVAEETYDQMQAHLETVNKMYNEGLVSEYDLIRSRVQVSNFYPQVINARTEIKVTFESLAIALGLPKDQEIELTDHLKDHPVGEWEVDDPFEIALANRSELQQMDLQKNILSKLLTIEKHGIWWPNIILVGGYTASAQEPEFDFENYYWMENLYAGVSLSIPLFDGLKTKHRTEQVKVDLKLLDIQKDQLVRGINLEIIQAQSKLSEAQKNVEAQEEGTELAKKALEIAQVRYQNGLATQLEVMDAQVALNQAKTNELSAHFAAISALAQMEKAVGKQH